jgi:hypothetical protein
VEAPYEGALWTPGYWGYAHNRYCYFRGYWGPHIGFYGGVNYGFGYAGMGYQGGYWREGHFNYNRSVNNVDITIVHNVYVYPVPVNNVRVSFHGGQGGIRMRPHPAELAALREPHAGPMQAQLQIEKAASTNRAQLASVNHGRPESLVVSKPVAADHGVHPVASAPMHTPPAPVAHNQPAIQQHAPAAMHANPVQPAHGRPAPITHPAQRPQTAAPRPMEHSAPARQAPGKPAPPQHAAPAHGAPQHPAEGKTAPGHPAQSTKHPGENPH